MENVTQETINAIVTNFKQLKVQFDKIDGIVQDLNKCTSEYSRTLLVSAIGKFSDQIGLKDSIFGQKPQS